MKRILPLLLALLLYAPLAFGKVPACSGRNDYTGNGATTAFTYGCAILDKAALEVLLDGVVKTVDSDYTVAGVANEAGGTITFTVAPGSGVKVTILRKQTAQQTSDYIQGESFPSTRVENDYDKIVMILQQANESLARAPKYSKKSTTANIDIVDDPTNAKYLCYKSATTLGNCDAGPAGPTGPQGPPGSAGSPGGSATQLQYNLSGTSFSGVTGATSDGTSITFGDDNIKVGIVQATNKVAPSTPAAGKTEVYVDSTDKRLRDKNDAGVVGTTVVADAGAANNFLTGITAAGAVTKAQPTEANLSLSDITTNDVSITKHGFVPKLPNDSTKFLNGVGAFAVPAGGGSAADVQIFTTTGANTWTKPGGTPKMTCAYLVGGGGGGGSGRRGAASTGRSGGGAGASGAYSEKCFPTSILGATETATVGAKGTGGAAQASNDTNGNSGNSASDTSFGTWLKASGGPGGIGGTSTSGAGGSASSEIGFCIGQSGGAGSTSTGNSPSSAPNITAGGCAAGAGAGGGGINSSDTEGTGGTGGPGSYLFIGFSGGSAGAICSNAGGATSTAANNPMGGGGGGGGGGCKTAVGGNGSAGGSYGGAGGGGGASLNGFNSGAGGNGADGIAIVATYF